MDVIQGYTKNKMPSIITKKLIQNVLICISLSPCQNSSSKPNTFNEYHSLLRVNMTVCTTLHISKALEGEFQKQAKPSHTYIKSYEGNVKLNVMQEDIITPPQTKISKNKSTHLPPKSRSVLYTYLLRGNQTYLTKFMPYCSQ